MDCEKKSIKDYIIHDNGDEPYKVCIDFVEKKVTIYKIDDVDAPRFEGTYSKILCTLFPIEIFVGNSSGLNGCECSGEGNTILLKMEPHVYTIIYRMIYTFKTSDEIIGYSSPIGNNDVPYPIAIGSKNMYFFSENVYIAINKYNKIDKAEQEWFTIEPPYDKNEKIAIEFSMNCVGDMGRPIKIIKIIDENDE